ncbi:MAG: hypothetical protein K2W85_14075 [Phycisphaerales bacterium]|nr:hypothetical protein [Phycisphaerales bacterium]
MLPPAFLVAQSFLDVTFRVDESTPYSIYSGEFLDETLMGGASVALYRGSDLTNLLVGINQQSPPVGGVLTPGVYRFRAIATSEPAGGGGGSNSFGRALATATLVVPSPAAAGLLVALGLISARRCRA